MQPIQMWRASIKPILSPSWGVLRVRVATVGHLHFCTRVSLTQLLPSMRLLNYLIGFMKAYWKSMPKHEFESENGTPAGEASRIVIAVQTYCIRRECLAPLVRTPHIWLQCSAEETAGDRGKHFGVWIWKWPRHAAMSCCKIQEKTTAQLASSRHRERLSEQQL